MKIRILPLFAVAMIAASSLFSSCLKNDYEEFDLPSTSSISSFSLGTLYQTIYKGSSEGKDTIDTVSYAKHPFVIDQLNRKIYNPDSLPKGVNVSKALVNISADGNVFYKYLDEEKEDTIWTPTDSLDLTRPITLKVLTYSPVYNDFRLGESYELKVNVHNLNPDSLVWNHYETSFASLTEQKAVYSNNYLYVFGKDENKEIKVYKLNVEKGNVKGGWTDLNISNNNINIYSALAYNNDVYYVAGGNLYKLIDNTKVGSESNLSSLISVSNGYMLAYTTDPENNVITLDKEGVKGESSTSEFDFSGRIFASSSQAEHNSSLWRTTVMSYNTATADTTANIFSYISSDEKWVESTPNNPVTCPNLKDISMVEYDGKLYAFGGKRDNGKTKIKAFESFYYSNNYGFDWRIEPNKYMKFTDEEGKNKIAEYYDDKPYSCVVETDNEGKESFIWFVWHNGKVSRAHLNKFAPKTNPQN